jgi:hypothetical protein
LFFSWTIFSHVYNYCTSNSTQTKSTSISHTRGGLSRSSTQDGANIVGGELYNKLKNYLKVYLEEICQVRKARENDLQFYIFFRVALIYKVKMSFVFIQLVGRNINSLVKL